GLLMKDTAHPERRSAYTAAADTPDAELVGILVKQIESEPIGLLKKVARDSLRHVQDKLGEQAQIADLNRRFAELQVEQKKAQARLAEIEARLAKAPRKLK
ncbi:MAG: hypothetical protein HYT80_09470, partial [Euryarchaeota archaeon]|nr:hypothetical protein [Euryarchaeota archaeon]